MPRRARNVRLEPRRVSSRSKCCSSDNCGLRARGAYPNLKQFDQHYDGARTGWHRKTSEQWRSLARSKLEARLKALVVLRLKLAERCAFVRVVAVGRGSDIEVDVRTFGPHDTETQDAAKAPADTAGGSAIVSTIGAASVVSPLLAARHRGAAFDALHRHGCGGRLSGISGRR